MQNKVTAVIVTAGVLFLMFSCSPGKISSRYYYQHEKVLDRIEETYKKLYTQQRFSIAFTDKSFNTVSLQIVTDTLNYIYLFAVDEPRLSDTLRQYHLDAPKVIELIKQVQLVHCAWINNYDYYENEKKKSLVFMSVKQIGPSLPISYKKFYILTYFPKPQYFDSTENLLDQGKTGRLRKINGEIFKRINDKVCYAISGDFR
jgi:hypothetical protein